MKKLEKILSVALLVLLLFSFSTISSYAKDEKHYVYLGGHPFGLKFYNDGLIVVELEEFYDGKNYICPAKKSGMRIRDIIKEVNGKKIKTTEDLQNIIINSNGNDISFIVEREGNNTEIIVTPEKNVSGMFLLGAWVRDSCAGIGTITYYDNKNQSFAALGHGVCDVDTSSLLPLEYGEIVQAHINGATKSVKGKAGSLDGYFTENSFGIVTKNTGSGIFGVTNDNFIHNDNMIEIADCNEIKKGKALLYTTITGTSPKGYEIEISKICNKNKQSNENFVIKITDNELLKNCGGIVQGMSGSPIVQDGKLVGAVTHVFVNNPSEGYGVITQNMVANFDD